MRGGRSVTLASLIAVLGAVGPASSGSVERDALPLPSSAALDGEDAEAALDPGGGVAARRGTWLRLGAVAREALPGASAWRVDLGAEPESGIGGAVGAGVLGGLDGAAILDLDGALVARRGTERFTIGAGLTRRGALTLPRLSGGVAIAPTAALVVGLDLRVFPGETGGAPDPRLTLAGAADPWIARVEVGGAPRAALGVRLAPRLWWSARLAGAAPALGIRWGVGAAELQAEEERHPQLGRVTRFAIAWGGRRR